MRKLLAVAMVATAAAGIITAGSAQADPVCTPITIDGRPIACVDPQPIFDEVNGVLAQVHTIVDPVVAVPTDYESCIRVEPAEDGSFGENIWVPIYASTDNGTLNCFGYVVTAYQIDTGAT